MSFRAQANTLTSNQEPTQAKQEQQVQQIKQALEQQTPTQTPTQTQLQTQTQVQTQVQNISVTENFDTFAQKFYSDATFQLSRVSFPVGVFYDSKQRKKVSYTKDNWVTLMRYKDMYTNEYPPFKKLTNGTYTYTQETDGGAVCWTYTFELKEDGLWYLVKIVSASL